MKKRIIIFTAFWVILFPITVLADLIDFESYSAGTNLGPVSTETNVVTFWASIHANGSGMFRAETKATQSGDPFVLGSMYLFDQNPQSHAESYFIQFENPVTDISLHFFDYEGISSNEAILTAFTNSDYTGDSSSVSVHPQGDLSIIAMNIADTSTPFLSLTLGFNPLNNDTSTGIDNLLFTTKTIPIPIPGAVWLLGSGLVGIVGIRRKLRK